MPNYRFNTSDYMRRNGCGRPAPTPAPMPQPVAPCQPAAEPVCCDDNAEYDELNGMPLAMAYVPWQHLSSIFEDLDAAYKKGTIFPELEKPFTGRRCVK